MADILNIIKKLLTGKPTKLSNTEKIALDKFKNDYPDERVYSVHIEKKTGNDEDIVWICYTKTKPPLYKHYSVNKDGDVCFLEGYGGFKDWFFDPNVKGVKKSNTKQ